MRNRSLNAEQWGRLAAAIRDVADTYLRYAIELSFLAQQTYNFESDKRLDVIRFDYDASDVGAMLAADFLLRDLDTIEQDYIVSQQVRLQQMRYVVSLTREYPSALQTLGADGSVTFSVRLEQLERHFPGMIGLRIAAVDVQPIALMDPTRVTVQLTALGGSVRLRRQPGGSPLDAADVAPAIDWLGDDGADWPFKLRTGNPETAVFTGLSRQDAASLSAITANERSAFEGQPAASSWQLELSARENQIVPETLADCLLTFVISGYHDQEFKNVVESRIANRPASPTVRVLSARRMFPDAYYSLVRYGRMKLPVLPRHLSLSGRARDLRNVAVLLPLTQDGPELGRSYCRYPIELDVQPGSNLQVLTALPHFTFAMNGLTLTCNYQPPAGSPIVASDVSWEFGDGSMLAAIHIPNQPTVVEHTYARPGRRELIARLVVGTRLVEYRAAICVSEQFVPESPLVVAPAITAGALTPDGNVPVTISLAAAGLSIDCTTEKGRQFADSGTVQLSLKPGPQLLRFVASRSLSCHFFGMQQYTRAVPVVLNRGRVSTNRTFVDDNETTTTPNSFTNHVFGGHVLSPVDRWSLELPIAANPWFRSASSSDVEQADFSELADAFIALEYVAVG
jgi:hypothetical protein